MNKQKMELFIYEGNESTYLSMALFLLAGFRNWKAVESFGEKKHTRRRIFQTLRRHLCYREKEVIFFKLS